MYELTVAVPRTRCRCRTLRNSATRSGLLPSFLSYAMVCTKVNPNTAMSLCSCFLVLRANDEAMQRWMKSKKCLLETHETTLTTLGLPELYKVYRLLFPTEAPQKFWSQLGPICSLMNVELLGTDPLRVLEMDNREREKLRVCFCFGEFVKNVALLSRTGDLRSRLRFLFDMFDEDQDGFLTVRDLRRMLATHASANKFLLSTDQLHELVEKIFTRLLMLDPKGTSSIAGCVSFDDFQLMFQPVFDRLDCSSWAPIQATTDKELGFKLMPNPTGVNRTDLRRVLNPERPVSLVRPIPSGNLVDERGPKQTRWKKWRDRIVYYAVQDGVRSVSYAVFTIVNLALFIYQIIASLGTDYYKAMGPMYSIAVASAICLNFNVAFIFLTMSRSFLALLRRIPLICRIFPFDHHVQFHRITGYLIVVLSLMHTGAHVFGNFITLSTPRTFSNPNNSFTHNFNGGQPMPYWQLLFATIPGATGLGMLLVLGCILGTSFKAVRTRNYELFFYVHHLFFVFVMLLLVHKNARYFGDPSTWKWIVGPGAIYLIGFFWRWAGSWLRKTSLVRAYFRKANVLSVEVLKPRAALQHRPGEYYFLNVPQLSPFQWHAFTTTASPLEDVLRFHIGCSGDWTSALADLLRSSETPPRILLDGPFGAPADRVYPIRVRHVDRHR